jgi:hypothetical protein
MVSADSAALAPIAGHCDLRFEAGSLGFCDRDAGVGFGYVTNELGPRWQTRATELSSTASTSACD